MFQQCKKKEDNLFFRSKYTFAGIIIIPISVTVSIMKYATSVFGYYTIHIILPKT